MMKKLWKRVAAAAIAGVIAFSFVGVVKAHDYERLATDETSIMRFFPMFRMMMVHAQDAPRMVICSATTTRQAACAICLTLVSWRAIYRGISIQNRALTRAELA